MGTEATDRLDAKSWEGPPAPEGSYERVEARRRLYNLAYRQIRILERPAEDWIVSVHRYAPQLVGAVGAEDVAKIAKLVQGLGR